MKIKRSDGMKGTTEAEPTVQITETVREAYQRMVLDVPSLLPRCEMPVALLLFAEWWMEQQNSRDCMSCASKENKQGPLPNSTGQERPSAAPAPNRCAVTDGVSTPGASREAGSLPTCQGHFVEEWERRLNAELWQAGPDGTMHWRDQGDGFFE